MMNEEIKLIENLIIETVVMEPYGKRDGLNQYQIESIDGEAIPEGYVFIVSLKQDLKVGGAAPGYFRSTSLGTDNYYGKLELYYCKKKKSLFGKETVKTLNSFLKTYHVKELESGEEQKVSLKSMMVGK